VKLRPYLEFAVQSAYEAGRLTLGYFGTEAARPEFKADDTPVTVADREAERLIRGRIEARYPNHGVLGEEFGETARSDSDHLWILDPIDGTKSFVRGVPLYGVLIGLEIDGVSTRTLAQGIACFTGAASFAEHGRGAAWERVLSAAGSARGWSDAYGHALVATGRSELMLDPIMNPWDCGPFPPILREAGGFFGDWSGNETIYANEAMSTTQTILSDVLRLVEGD
jgi:histidinol-phosphatase